MSDVLNPNVASDDAEIPCSLDEELAIMKDSGSDFRSRGSPVPNGGPSEEPGTEKPNGESEAESNNDVAEEFGPPETIRSEDELLNGESTEVQEARSESEMGTQIQEPQSDPEITLDPEEPLAAPAIAMDTPEPSAEQGNTKNTLEPQNEPDIAKDFVPEKVSNDENHVENNSAAEAFVEKPVQENLEPENIALAEALEQMTEESAREILSDSENISEGAEKVINTFARVRAKSGGDNTDLSEDDEQRKASKVPSPEKPKVGDLMEDWTGDEEEAEELKGYDMEMEELKGNDMEMEDVVDEFLGEDQEKECEEEANDQFDQLLSEEEEPTNESVVDEEKAHKAPKPRRRKQEIVEKVDSDMEQIIINPKPIIFRKRKRESSRTQETSTRKRANRKKSSSAMKNAAPEVGNDEVAEDEIEKIVDFMKKQEEQVSMKKTASSSSQKRSPGKRTPRRSDTQKGAKMGATPRSTSRKSKTQRSPENELPDKSNSDSSIPLNNQPQITKTEDQTENQKSVEKKIDPKRQFSSTYPTSSGYVKPVQNWYKVLKMPQNPDLCSRWGDIQIFKNSLTPYVPCVPPNTSQRLIDHLSENDVEQLSCPGCKDRFLLPTTFFQHLYRKSVRITFKCPPCGNLSLSFHNKCHLRIHILSHLEIDSLSSVPVTEPETLTVAPLPEDELGVGFFDRTFSDELDNVHDEFTVLDEDRCPECKLMVGRANMKDHFQKEGTEMFECKRCSMTMPSPCSLSSHTRAHDGANQPYVCPECGVFFQTQEVFVDHVQNSCHHESRVLTVRCQICDKSGKEEGKAVSYNGVLGHIYQKRVKLYYRCTGCPRAFTTKMAIYDHRAVAHKDVEDKSMSDFTLLYRAKFLRKPKNIFSTREGFEERIQSIISSWERSYKHTCLACQTFFNSASDMLRHNSRWCQLQTNNWITSKLFSKEALKQNDPKIMAQKEKESKIHRQISRLQDVCGEDCNNCLAIIGSFNDHISTEHNKVVKSELRNGEEDDEAYHLSETEEVDLDNLPRITRKRLSEIVKPSEPAPEVIKVKKVQASTPKVKQKKSVPEVKAFVESLGKDVPSSGQLLAYNRLSRKALVFGSTVADSNKFNSAKGQVNGKKFKCAICDFTTDMRDSFQAHIAIHRPKDSNADCMQCKKCGMCFASVPSWKKHLFLIHGIRKPDPDDYCADLVVKEDDNNVRGKVKDDYCCEVCDKTFSSELELNRHFRSHGMAFLKHKQTK